jgi:excisionase family DNA binding protein
VLSSKAQRANLIDIARAAERLGVTVRYVRRLVAERRIPYVKLGHLVRFDPIELEAWIDASARSRSASPGARRSSSQPASSSSTSGLGSATSFGAKLSAASMRSFAMASSPSRTPT